MNASRIAYLESPAYLNANRGPALFDTTIAFTTLETVFISLYLVSRILERSAKSWDVYLMGLGYVFDLSLSAVVFGKPGLFLGNNKSPLHPTLQSLAF